MSEKNMQMELLKNRFHKYPLRHSNIEWSQIESILNDSPQIYETVVRMENSGGEPDVVGWGGKLYYVDMSKETPKDRRSVCYDEEARLARTKFPPVTSAEAMAKEIGISILDEETYLYLQSIEDLDLKTSSWLKSPDSLRRLGGALFGDKRYDRTFIYHNGADSYYGVRGFRGYIQIT